MTFDDFENLFTLFCSIVGLLACLFKYINSPKRGFLYLVIFFLAHFFSDFYWTIYGLIMHDSPNISGFLSYLGWNIAYFILILMAIHFRKNKERYFNPLMLWPLLTNIPLFFLYIKFGGIFNNIWQVGTTTIAMIFCSKNLLYYFTHKKAGVHFPRLSFLILLFLICGYGMWTASCFDWSSEITNPYLYFTILAYLCVIFFAWSAEKDYEKEDQIVIKKNEAQFRLQTLLQTITSFVLLGTCAIGYFIVVWMKNTMTNIGGNTESANSIVTMIFVISVVLILLVMSILYFVTYHYRNAQKKQQKIDAKKLSKVNFIVTVSITVALMALAVIYNTKSLSKTASEAVYENGEDKVKIFSTDLESYLVEAETSLRIIADSIEIMIKNGASSQDINQYLINQTNNQSEHFDENFTGFYAYINGQFMDGSGWVPPEDYDPETRDWYKTAVQATGDITFVSPYIDAQTGSGVITIEKIISNGKDHSNNQPCNVVCIDVIANHVKEVTKQVNIGGKGYGMVINEEGYIFAHSHEEYNEKNFTDFYDKELLTKIITTKSDRFQSKMNNEKCTIFVSPFMKQLYAVVVVNDTELFESVKSLLVINIMISLITFSLILFFYYLGYKNERIYGKKIEELNVQVVSALATAIDAKDSYTNGHSARVAKYSKMIANRLGFSASKQDEIYMMGLLHDIGKIGIMDDVINKPGKLTDDEFEAIKKHPDIGSKILENIRERHWLYTGARWHHERFEGGGYPDGLVGDKIPAEARIIAVADAYDAMTSTRSYRDIMPQDKVREEIKKGSGTQFDPEYAQVMLSLIDEDTDYSLRGK